MSPLRLGHTLRDGIAAVQARQFDRARLLLERCASDTPDDPRVWFWLAIAAPSGAMAIPCLRRVVALDPRHAQARAALAKLLLVQAVSLPVTDRPQARALLLEASAIAPELDGIWIGLAAVCEAPAERVGALRRAFALRPERADLRVRLHDALVHHAVMLAKTAHTAEARALFEEASEMDPQDVRVWQALARLAETPAGAVRACRELVRLAPEQPAHRAALEKALAAEAAAPRPRRDRAPRSQPAPRPRDEAPRSLPAPHPRPGEAPRSPSAPTAPPAVRPGAQPPAAAAKSAATVMVVDDSPTIRKILGLMLERAGYRVVAEADGERALARLADVVPDLILLDIAMPKLDGYDVCKRIRKDPRTAQVPVVMLSGKDGFFDKVKGRMAGASEYLTKPFEAPAVLAVIGKHCRRGEEVAHG